MLSDVQLALSASPIEDCEDIFFQFVSTRLH